MRSSLCIGGWCGPCPNESRERLGIACTQATDMAHYLWTLRPYYRQTAGQLVLGSLAGVVMNTAVVLPAVCLGRAIDAATHFAHGQATRATLLQAVALFAAATLATEDRKSTRLNSSHSQISYAVFCLKKKKKTTTT